MPFSSLSSSGRVMLVTKAKPTLVSATAESSTVTGQFFYERGEPTRFSMPVAFGPSKLIWEGGTSMAPSCSTGVTSGTLVPSKEDPTYTKLLLFGGGDAELPEAQVVLGTPD
ncbi:hypothetical protein LguiA_029889 [Lonicera macranthoides]